MSRIKVAAVTVSASLLCVATQAPFLNAQWLNYPAPGIPRTPDGKPNLAAPTPRTGMENRICPASGTGRGREAGDRNVARDLSPKDIQPWAEAAVPAAGACDGQGRSSRELSARPFSLLPYGRFGPDGPNPRPIVMLYQGTTNSVHRTIFTDDVRSPKDPNPTWMGYSVGHWEADTLVVDTTGFNDRSWLDIEGHPHTEALHITERFRAATSDIWTWK